MWPSIFETERIALAELLAPWIVGAIEHVGSTAVPGLAAKPIVDIMIGVANLDLSEPAISALESAAYCYFPYRADVMHWFCKPSPFVRTHHLHLVPFRSPLWLERLAFRDYLLAHNDVALEYAELKKLLADKYRSDREAYTDAKGPFIQRILELAQSQGTV
jgi:GrpB-like predicted nucleotidyltransferase (UPF0157 family)